MEMLPAILDTLIVLAVAVWAYLVFAMVMDQRRDAGRRSGQPFAGCAMKGGLGCIGCARLTITEHGGGWSGRH